MTSSIGSSPPTVCVLGATGVGKGATLNSCFGTDRFGTSFGAASHTIRPQLLELPWRGRGPLLRGPLLRGYHTTAQCLGFLPNEKERFTPERFVSKESERLMMLCLGGAYATRSTAQPIGSWWRKADSAEPIIGALVAPVTQ